MPDIPAPTPTSTDRSARDGLSGDLDTALAALPRSEPSEQVVQRTLRAVEQRRSRPRLALPQLAMAGAGLLTLAIGIALPLGVLSDPQYKVADTFPRVHGPVLQPESPPVEQTWHDERAQPVTANAGTTEATVTLADKLEERSQTVLTPDAPDDAAKPPPYVGGKDGLKSGASHGWDSRADGQRAVEIAPMAGGGEEGDRWEVTKADASSDDDLGGEMGRKTGARPTVDAPLAGADRGPAFDAGEGRGSRSAKTRWSSDASAVAVADQKNENLNGRLALTPDRNGRARVVVADSRDGDMYDPRTSAKLHEIPAGSYRLALGKGGSLANAQEIDAFEPVEDAAPSSLVLSTEKERGEEHSEEEVDLEHEAFRLDEDLEEDKSRRGLDLDDRERGDKTKAPPVVKALSSLLPTQGLAFQAARGYFRNSYHGGDPELAWLRQRTQGGLLIGGKRLALDGLARAVAQPFDPPDSSGLALFLDADATAVAGRTRLTVQVGLKGAEHGSTSRAPLNVALVLDLGGVADDSERRLLWSVADTLATGQVHGDRLAVFVTGVPDPQMELRPGFHSADALRTLAEAYGTRQPGTTSRQEALDLANAWVTAGVRDDAPLGANGVVLVTSDATRLDEVQAMEGAVEAAAIDGITTSVIGVGDRVDAASLSLLARVGQGRRWLGPTTERAKEALSAEFAAAGRVVARAVRLRIRLAEGVELVRVIGSERLDATRADRVRTVERAIDARVAAATGITADRGDDEDGIQIVIPAYYAGDDHVVLLDVVVPGPGPIGDVRVRYKDLIRMTNGEVSARLALPEGEPELTPRTLNVAKNRAAQEGSEVLAEAAAALAQGDHRGARDRIAAHRAHLATLAAAVEALEDDADLTRDRAMLTAYLELFDDAHAWVDDPALVRHVHRSLTLAAKIKGGAP